jgi:uracil-DNA glycosylase family 4
MNSINTFYKEPSMTKEQALAELYAKNRDCPACLFGKQEPNHKVFGEGPANATIMFIGEAPGAEEDRLKRPFVGRSGKLLEKTLLKLGVTRPEVFITNIVKCRPPDNRTPLPHEITSEAKKILKDEIKIIKPRVICTLGIVPTRLFITENIAMSQLHGKPIRFPGAHLIVIPTYHPAYILRNASATPLFESDLKAVIIASKNPK